MVKHNLCAKLGADYLVLYYISNKFYKKNSAIVKILILMEALMFGCSMAVNIGNHHFWLICLGIHAFIYGMFTIYRLLCYFFKSKFMKRIYKSINKILYRLKVNSYDEYLQRKLNK